MALCSFSDDFLMYDVTPVENLFIQEFLPRAPGDYVRVYLYGLMQCYHPSEEMSMERIARTLDLEIENVASAFRYWERQGAVTRVSDKPPAYRFLNLKAAMLAGREVESDVYKFRDYNNKLQSLFGSSRLLHPQEFEKACEWVEDLKLPEEVALLMVKGQIERRGSRVTFNTLDKVALSWAENDVRTLQAAEDMVMRDSKTYQTAQKILRQFNLRRSPTRDELDLMKKWMEDWALEPNAILYACKETVKGLNPSFGYLDGILTRNHEAHTHEEMVEKMAREQQLFEAVKQVNRALGSGQASPTPEQLASYAKYLDAGFEAEAILKIAEMSARKGRRTMDDLEKSLTKCVEMSLYTKDEIDLYLKEREKIRGQAARVLTCAGLERNPSNSDLMFLESWLKEQPMELILYAAQCAAGTQLPIRYMDKLLKKWQAGGIRDVESARQEAGPRPGPITTPVTAKTVIGQKYQQRDYKEGELDYLFVDLQADEEEKQP